MPVPTAAGSTHPDEDDSSAACSSSPEPSFAVSFGSFADCFDSLALSN